MTVARLVKIVCQSLDEVGITPLNSRSCGTWAPAELDLDGPTLTRLFTVISRKLKAAGQTAVLGKTMWRQSKSVREFCAAVVENLE